MSKDKKRKTGAVVPAALAYQIAKQQRELRNLISVNTDAFKALGNSLVHENVFKGMGGGNT